MVKNKKYTFIPSLFQYFVENCRVLYQNPEDIKTWFFKNQKPLTLFINFVNGNFLNEQNFNDNIIQILGKTGQQPNQFSFLRFNYCSDNNNNIGLKGNNFDKMMESFNQVPHDADFKDELLNEIKQFKSNIKKLDEKIGLENLVTHKIVDEKSELKLLNLEDASIQTLNPISNYFHRKKINTLIKNSLKEHFGEYKALIKHSKKLAEESDNQSWLGELFDLLYGFISSKDYLIGKKTAKKAIIDNTLDHFFNKKDKTLDDVKKIVTKEETVKTNIDYTLAPSWTGRISRTHKVMSLLKK